MDYSASAELSRLAAACAAHLPNPATAASVAGAGFDARLNELVQALCDADPQFMFDRKGRPPAIETIQRALSGVEATLLEAVLEDHACELAAMKAAFLQVALAYGRSLARITS